MTDLKKVVGFKISAWTNPQTGVIYPVRKLYVVYPSGAEGVTGLVSSSIKCKSEKVFDGIEVGDYVELFYDQYGNCLQVSPCVPNEEDLSDFGEID